MVTAPVKYVVRYGAGMWHDGREEMEILAATIPSEPEVVTSGENEKPLSLIGWVLGHV